MDRVLILLAVLAATGLLAAWWRARDGQVRPAAAIADDGQGTAVAADVVAAVRPTTPLVLVEFTAPDCVPCARTKAVLDAIAADRADVSVATIDVADGLDLARAHRVLRAPTTLLVTAGGELLGRVAGVPRADELTALLDGTRARAA